MSQPFGFALDLLDRTFRSKPLLFFTAAWMLGIGLADYCLLSPVLACGAGLALGMAALAVRQRWPALILLLLAIGALGLASTRLALTPPRGDVSGWAGRQVMVFGIVDSEPRQGCDTWHCFLRCQQVRYGQQMFPVRGWLFLSTRQELSQVEPGYGLVVDGVPERPSPARNPGGFSSELWLARHGAFAALSARRHAVVPLGWFASDWRPWAGWLRHLIAEANRRAIRDKQAAALVNSILFGDLDQDDPRRWGDTEERFRRAGVYHVLVVSGAQVALVAGLLFAWRWWVLRPRRRATGRHWRLLRATGGYSLRAALAMGMLLVAVYVPLAGLQSSVLRAAFVVLIFFVGRCLDRESDPENSLAAAALILLVANPLTLYDIGFCYSFAAVWGILRWTEPLANALCRSSPRGETGSLDRSDRSLTTRLWRLAATALAVSLSAQLATAPLIAHHLQTVSPAGLFSNLPVCFMADLLLPIGLITSLLNLALLPAHGSPWLLVQCANWPTEQLARIINGCVTALASPSWATLPVFPPSWPEVALVAALILAGSLPAMRKRLGLSLALAGLAVILLADAMLRPAPPVGVPTLTFIDVGQGDACLVRLPGGTTMLVDGGGSPRAPCERRDCADAPVGHLADTLRSDCRDVGRDVLACYLRYERVRRIDLMVVTHPHDDHLWGLDALLDPREGFQVGAVLDAGRPFTSPANREWAELLRQRHLVPIAARRGMALTLGPARLEVLHPNLPFLQHTRNDENNNSVVLRMDLPGTRVLLTGDAEAAAEAAMAGEDVRADLLKVGHHGSAYSTSDTWLDRVRPRIAVISCGPHNPFGHPSPHTLDRLRRHRVQVYRTDQDGAVTLELRREGWCATTMRGYRAGGKRRELLARH